VCRSLFEKDKLLFSFLLAAKVEFGKTAGEDKQLQETYWRYFLAGPTGEIKVMHNPTLFISESSWPDIYRQFYGMKELPRLSAIY
jgi:dynein heavy chain